MSLEGLCGQVAQKDKHVHATMSKIVHTTQNSSSQDSAQGDQNSPQGD